LPSTDRLLYSEFILKEAEMKLDCGCWVAVFLVVGILSSEAIAQEESFYKFSSDQTGVSIHIDGSFVGKTDPSVSGAISVGTHRVKARYPGYADVEKTLAFKVDELVKFHFRLAPSSVKVESLNDSSQATLKAKVGNLIVTSIPPDLPVKVGARELDKNTPCKVSGWPVGNVRVEIDGHGLAAAVNKGVTTKIRYDLNKNTYRQTFQSTGFTEIMEEQRFMYMPGRHAILKYLGGDESGVVDADTDKLIFSIGDLGSYCDAFWFDINNDNIVEVLFLYGWPTIEDLSRDTPSYQGHGGRADSAYISADVFSYEHGEYREVWHHHCASSWKAITDDMIPKIEHRPSGKVLRVCGEEIRL
jgi:hypothetical protein